jgi:protein tyrosine phosphatase (PTP) superfamily phosphohydrolase (DUF442 family)
MRHKGLVFAAALALALVVCFLLLRSRKPSNAIHASTNGLPASVHLVQAAGLSNFYQLNDRVFSGSSPNSDAALASLTNLGIKTIISVEGTKPDVEAARKFGLRYVHLPIGYSGLSTEQANRIVKAAASLPGPVYVHCQYGWQRGPTGAALICQGLDGWNPQQATAWLTVADKTSNYTGLFLTVQNFRAPAPAVLGNLPEDFPETTEVTDLAKEMVQFQEHYKTLRQFRQAGFQKLPAHSELTAADEARIFLAQIQDLQKSALISKYDSNFHTRLADTEIIAKMFQENLLASPRDTNALDMNLRQFNVNCVNCHRDYRK